MTLHEQTANFLMWFWAEMVNHLWQSTLFFLFVVGAAFLLRKSQAKARYFVWLTASVKFFLPLAVFIALGQQLNVSNLLPSGAIDSSSIYSDSLNSIIAYSLPATGSDEAVLSIQTDASHNEIYCVLTLIWLIGCVLLFILWRKRSRAFKALLKRENSQQTARERGLLKNAQIRLGFNSPVDLIVSDFILEPVVWGIRNPVIAIPAGLPEKLSDDEFEAILMHELAHVARRDNLAGVAQMTLCCLLWFCPFVWFIKRKMLEERERSCDEMVIRHEREPNVYAKSLLKVVKFGLHAPEAPGSANAAGSDLKKRLEVIMKNKTEYINIKWQKWIVGVTVASLILVCLFAGFSKIAKFETVQADSSEGISKENIAQLTQSPPKVIYKSDEGDDSPIKIVEVKSKLIPPSEIPKPVENVPVLLVYSDLEIKLQNVSGKTITGASILLKYPRTDAGGEENFTQGLLQGTAVKGYKKLSIAPGQSWTVRMYAAKPDFSVVIGKAIFNDKTSWTAK